MLPTCPSAQRGWARPGSHVDDGAKEYLNKNIASRISSVVYLCIDQIVDDIIGCTPYSPFTDCYSSYYHIALKEED